MRLFLLGCVAPLAFATSTSAAEPNLLREFGVIGKALTESKCDVPRIRRLTERSDFQTLNGGARSLAYTALAACDDAGRHEAVLKATAEPEAVALAWSLRFLDADMRKDWADAVTSIGKAVDRKTDGTLTFFSDDVVYEVGRGVRDDADAFRRYAAELDRGDWKAADRYYRGDWIWARYAGLLAQAGDRTHAWRVASRVGEPGELLRMSLDKRYDAITEVDSSRFEMVAATEAELARVQALAAADARDGAGVSTVVSMLRMLGRQQEALALLDRTLALPGKIVSTRGDDHRNWLINDRALVLLELGRFDEGVAAMQAAAGLSERGGVNVSQTINLSGVQVSAGHFEAALKTLGEGEAAMQGKVSPYGRMWIAAERTCAEAGLGRKADAARSLAAAAAEAKENPSAYAKALLCAGDLDGLAGAFKARLADPSTRGAALTQLSRFREPPMTPFDSEMSRRMETLRTRPDIKAAIAEVGRIKDVPLQSGALIDGY